MLKKQQKIAVLLAAFNGRQWLWDQIESILAQEGIAVTLFISVDRSNDGTEDFLDQLASLQKNIVLLPHGSRFGGAGSNFFRLIRDVDFSKFDYVAFADQDDVWKPSKLSRASHRIAAAGVDAYSSNVTAFWPSGRQKLIKKSQAQTDWDFLFEAAGPGCTYVLSAKLAKDIQQFVISHGDQVDKIALHDWFMYAFARNRGYRWLIDAEPSMLYRQHAENQVGANAGLKAFLYRVGKVLNGWGLGQSALIADALGLLKDQSVSVWLSGTRLGYLRLAIRFWVCRRRLRDKFLFLAACLMLAVIGSKIKK